jgi:hypothetical protein
MPISSIQSLQQLLRQVVTNETNLPLNDLDCIVYNLYQQNRVNGSQQPLEKLNLFFSGQVVDLKKEYQLQFRLANDNELFKRARPSHEYKGEDIKTADYEVGQNYEMLYA